MIRLTPWFVALATTFAFNCAALRAGMVFFSDGTFNDSDWTLVIKTSGNGGTVSASQYTSGGNPGAYRRIENTVNAGSKSSPSVVYGFHIRSGATYDPSTQGPIAYIDYSEDSRMFSGFGDGQGTGPALLQSGKYYYASGLYAKQSVWTTQTLSSLVAADFVNVSDPNDHPDFSASGAPITFGFVRYNSTRSAGYSITAGIDNWEVSVASVPEPRSLKLFVTALALLLLWPGKHLSVW